MDKVKALDKAFNLYERFFNLGISILVFGVSNTFYWLHKFNIGNGDNVSIFFAEKILAPREGILVTVAAVFIGIYFTVISILGAIKLDSTLAKLTKSKFFKLVTFIRNAFIFAFLYLLFTIFYPWLSDHLTGYPKQLLYLILIILFLNMFLSVLKVGLALFLVFKRDLSNLHEGIEEEKEEKKKQRIILLRLEKFLNEQDTTSAMKKAKEMNDIIKLRNPKK